MVKNESGTGEFPCFSVGATPFWGKGQWVKNDDNNNDDDDDKDNDDDDDDDDDDNNNN